MAQFTSLSTKFTTVLYLKVTLDWKTWAMGGERCGVYVNEWSLRFCSCRWWSKQFDLAWWSSMKTQMWMYGFLLGRPCKHVIRLCVPNSIVH
jgi:hypothetical protein